MGLEDHLGDEVVRILDLGLDLNYLHVESMDRPLGPSALAEVATEKTGARGGGGSPSPGESEESTGSDGEGEPTLVALPSEASAEEEPERPDMTREYRAKVEFALKLGYSEELVRLVLGKLGVEALINDVLGELVKLGSKVESEASGPPVLPAPSASSSSSSSSSSASSPSGIYRRGSASQRPSSPLGSVDDADNLRPIVLDGSNVAMRSLLQQLTPFAYCS
ncbi:putative ribonuclease ZC3H12C [Arapaima gigas]